MPLLGNSIPQAGKKSIHNAGPLRIAPDVFASYDKPLCDLPNDAMQKGRAV